MIDGEIGVIRQFATVTDPVSERCLKAYTDLPGVQFYAGNFIGRQTGKGGTVYDVRSGLCLETQYFPDTANKPAFPQAVFGPDKSYKSMTIYQFCS